MFYASSCPGGSLCRRISAGHPSLHLTIMVSMHQGIEALRIGIVEASMRHRRDRSEHGLNPPIWEPRNPVKSQPSSEGVFSSGTLFSCDGRVNCDATYKT